MDRLPIAAPGGGLLFAVAAVCSRILRGILRLGFKLGLSGVGRWLRVVGEGKGVSAGLRQVDCRDVSGRHCCELEGVWGGREGRRGRKSSYLGRLR